MGNQLVHNAKIKKRMMNLKKFMKNLLTPLTLYCAVILKI